MIIIKPILINETTLFDSNVPEDEYPMWVSGQNTNIGDYRIYEHRIYLNYTGNESHTTPPPDQPDHWQDQGATNRYRLFDQSVSNPTTNSGTIDFTLRLGANANAVTLFNVSAASVRVIMTDPIDGVVYDRTIMLTDYTAIIDWYAYQFEPVGERENETTFLDLPTYAAADIRVIVDAGAGIASCGEVVVGSQKKIGTANFGTAIEIIDFSRKETDQFGNVIIVERKFSKAADYDVTIQTMGLAQVQKFMALIRATPCVFIGDEDRDETIVYGFYKSFKPVISGPVVSSCNLRVEGLT